MKKYNRIHNLLFSQKSVQNNIETTAIFVHQPIVFTLFFFTENFYYKKTYYTRGLPLNTTQYGFH